MNLWIETCLVYWHVSVCSTPKDLIFWIVTRASVRDFTVLILNPNRKNGPTSFMDGPLIAIAIINKTPLRNGNCPITDPIAEMGVAHTVGQRIWNVTLWWLQLHCVVQIDSSHATIMFYQKILSSFTCLNIQIKSQFNRNDQILQDYSWYVLFNRTRLFCL